MDDVTERSPIAHCPSSVWRDNWKHLRLPFQLTLAPIFLWGGVLAGMGDPWRFWAAFASFHLLLYPGITAYNTWFDRDEGPVGGLERPPGVHSSLPWLAVALKLCGFPLALLAGPAVGAIYLAFVPLSVLYSHPRFRWKADPWRSAAIVCGGQGALGFLAGWATAQGGIGSVLGAKGTLGLGSAALTTLGMYPLTQLFQVEEDRRRGDGTLCVTLGCRRGALVSQAALLLGGACAVALAITQAAPADAALLAAAFVALAGAAHRLGRLAESSDSRALFRPVLALNYAASAGFALFILLRASRW